MVDDKVIKFPDPKAQHSYWVCGCGCMTHLIREDGEIECMSCGVLANGTDGGLYFHKPEGVRREYEQLEESPFTVGDNVDALPHRRWAERLKAGEFMIMIGLRRDGQVATHGSLDDLETVDQKTWLRRQLRAAYKLLTRPAKGRV